MHARIISVTAFNKVRLIVRCKNRSGYHLAPVPLWFLLAPCCIVTHSRDLCDWSFQETVFHLLMWTRRTMLVRFGEKDGWHIYSNHLHVESLFMKLSGSGSISFVPERSLASLLSFLWCAWLHSLRESHLTFSARDLTSSDLHRCSPLWRERERQRDRERDSQRDKDKERAI